jgi:hypothetical protein
MGIFMLGVILGELFMFPFILWYRKTLRKSIDIIEKFNKETDFIDEMYIKYKADINDTK